MGSGIWVGSNRSRLPPHADLQGIRLGVADGIRTRDRRDHNAELYQLSYSHLAGFKSSGSGRGDGLGPGARMRPARLRRPAREVDLIVDRALAQEADVLGVVLVQAPGVGRRLLGKLVERAEDVAGLEVDEGFEVDRGVRRPRGGDAIAL